MRDVDCRDRVDAVTSSFKFHDGAATSAHGGAPLILVGAETRLHPR